jgi:CRISPR/Cas system-associated protein Csm6
MSEMNPVALSAASAIGMLVSMFAGAFIYYCGTARRNPVQLPQLPPSKTDPEQAPVRAPFRSGM